MQRNRVSTPNPRSYYKISNKKPGFYSIDALRLLHVQQVKLYNFYLLV
jgi:hypothetical protein